MFIADHRAQVPNMKRTYLNLTNGLEFITAHTDSWGSTLPVVRIQSTACEQKRWDFILQDLDYQFLIDLALGFDVVVIDGSARKSESRAVYQGLVWIKYALTRLWLSKASTTVVRGTDCSTYFAHCFAELDRSTIAKLKYVKKFLATDEVHLSGICFGSTLDGNYEKLIQQLHEYYIINTDVIQM